MLALFLDDDLNSFLGELTTDPRCCMESLRKLEETADSADGHANGRGFLALTTTARETVFAIRGQLAEAALRRLQVRPIGPPRARLARAEGITAPPAETASSSPPPPAGAPSAQICSPPTAYSTAFVATCCRLTAEQAHGHGFLVAASLFRGQHGYLQEPGGIQAAQAHCLKCRVGDVTDVPFLDCSLHGASAAPAPNTPTVGRTRAARRS